MNSRQFLIRDVLVLLAFTGWALALPFYTSEFVTSMALTCLMYVALSSSWGLFCGSTRYLSLATSAFFGIGAYTTAILLGQFGWVETILIGAGISVAVAVLMGAAVLHLRGTYFAVLTFGMTELILHAVTYFEKSVTGTVGRVLTVVPERDTIYLTVLALAVLSVAVSIWVRRTRFGLALMGIGADEQRAQTLGVNTRLIKIAGFALTAAFAGAVGAAMAVPLDLHRPAHGLQPLHRFPDRAHHPHRWRAHALGPADCGHHLQRAGRVAAPAVPADLSDVPGPAAHPLRALPAGRSGLAALGHVQELVDRHARLGQGPQARAQRREGT